MSLKAQAEQISSEVIAKVGFDPITIITILLPLLINCFKSQATGQTPHEYLADHYDEGTQSFDQSLINRVRPQTRRAARQEGQRGLNRDQLDAISVASLEKARTTDEATIVAVMSEV
jgi:hypothetical protein